MPVALLDGRKDTEARRALRVLRDCGVGRSAPRRGASFSRWMRGAPRRGLPRSGWPGR